MKQKYKKVKNTNKNTKKIIILAVVFIILIIVFNSILTYLEKGSNNTIGEYTSIQQVLEKYECTYIKETKSKENNYYLDIYLKFKYNTFEENKSKQRFYENVISGLTQVIGNNFRLIDEEKELIIEIVKNDVADNIIYSYLINGIDNYFSIQESKILLQTNNEVKNTKLEINSEILSNLVQNKWEKDGINFGSKDSTFDGYDIYFDEGIEVRTISQKIYNIVFTSKYDNPVVAGIVPGTDFEQIIAKLGEITFGMEDGQYIGYKNENLYVFFTKNTISIFRNEIIDMEEFEKLTGKYINKEIELKEFMNEITYLWNDYEEYTYDSNSIYINYPLKGVRIDMSIDNSLGIQIYNNSNITEGISDLIEKGKITGCLDEDLIELAILKEINKVDDYRYMSDLKINEKKTFDSNIYYSNIKDDSVLFIAKNDENSNKELNEKISQGFFINDNIYIYSCEGKGIYSFNVLTNEKQALVTGEETFELKTFENQVLKYDDKELKIVME